MMVYDTDTKLQSRYTEPFSIHNNERYHPVHEIPSPAFAEIDPFFFSCKMSNEQQFKPPDKRNVTP